MLRLRCPVTFRLLTRFSSLLSAVALVVTPAISRGWCCDCECCPGAKRTGESTPSCCPAVPVVCGWCCRSADQDDKSAAGCWLTDSRGCLCADQGQPIGPQDFRSVVVKSETGPIWAPSPADLTAELRTTETALRADNLSAAFQPPFRVLYCSWIE